MEKESKSVHLVVVIVVSADKSSHRIGLRPR